MTRAGRVLLVTALLAVAAMWIYAFSGAAGDDHPDRLEETAFASAARPECEAAQAAIDRLPGVDEIDSPSERAVVVDEANETLRAMVADLRALDMPPGDDARIIAAWLGDWDTYIGDRQAWADSLRRGEDGQFFETEKGGGPISELMDGFATVNDLEACQTPDDV